METIDIEVRSECDMEDFLSLLADQLESREEATFIINCPHPEWANIILDNVEADSKYQLPADVTPFIDVYFQFPEGTVDSDPLDELEDLLRQLRDALEEEGGDDTDDYS